MLLWYQNIEEGKVVMTLFSEKFEKVEEAVETANQMPFDKFQITNPKNGRVLNGTRVWGELLWRMEGKTPKPLIPKSY